MRKFLAIEKVVSFNPRQKKYPKRVLAYFGKNQTPLISVLGKLNLFWIRAVGGAIMGWVVSRWMALLAMDKCFPLSLGQNRRRRDRSLGCLRLDGCAFKGYQWFFGKIRIRRLGCAFEGWSVFRRMFSIHGWRQPVGEPDSLRSQVTSMLAVAFRAGRENFGALKNGTIRTGDRTGCFGQTRWTIRTGGKIVADWLNTAKEDGLTGFWGLCGRILG